MNFSLNELYRIIGISKQGVHQYWKRRMEFEANLYFLREKVDEIRKKHPGCGLEKIYYTIKPDFIGRDRFIKIFMELGYRVKYLPNRRRTTFSVYSIYPNLIKGLKIREKNKVWQSDITYYQVGDKFFYIVFIMDIYTKEIIGFKASDHMRATANIAALKTALKELSSKETGLIHHSDRGSQFVNRDYLKLLKENSIKVSMAKTSQDNAYVERVNGIIKNEYLQYRKINSFSMLKTELKKAVLHYKYHRIHNGLPGKTTPADFVKFIENTNIENRPILHIFKKDLFIKNR